MISVRAKKLVLDALDARDYEKELVYDLADRGVRGAAKQVGSIYYIQGSTLDSLDGEDEGTWSDFLLMEKHKGGDPSEWPDLDSVKALSGKNVALVAVDFDETPRGYPISLFTKNFGPGEFSTSRFG